MKTKRFATVMMLTLAMVMMLAGGLQAHSPALGDGGAIAGKVTNTAGQPLAGAAVQVNGPQSGSATTDGAGAYAVSGLKPGDYVVTASKSGHATMAQKHVKVTAGKVTTVNFQLGRIPQPKPEPAAEEKKEEKSKVMERRVRSKKSMMLMGSAAPAAPARRPMPTPTPDRAGPPADGPAAAHDTESYDRVYENPFLAAVENPLSTFSIDVDTASYANVRRFLNQSRMPPKDAVRIEEFINYFNYQYPDPEGKHPFSVTMEISDCPWNDAHRLVHIGLQGKKIAIDKLPNSNLVFLLDVSGSMSSPNKLPLLKAAFKLLVKNLRKEDRVAIVVYAGAAGLVLPSTPGNEKEKIFAALDKLQAGGSTAGGAGIKLAYKTARDNFIENGNNRIILATDGDFNVGASSDSEMVRLVEEKRNEGVFLTTLGFGMGNYKDSKMEKLADKGNGNYAYIDSILEAKKVLVTEMGGTLLTIAKDVKLQIEFNPAKVKGYRLIGYENRMLRKEDFDDDTKDAGELGAGHTVTALYELIPAGSAEEIPGSSKLKYQKSGASTTAQNSNELMTVKLRYKAPKEDKSQLIVQPLEDKGVVLAKTSDNFRWSAGVATFGLLLRGSQFKGSSSYKLAKRLAEGARGKDENGYRHEFIKLVEKAELLAESK